MAHVPSESSPGVVRSVVLLTEDTGRRLVLPVPSIASYEAESSEDPSLLPGDKSKEQNIGHKNEGITGQNNNGDEGIADQGNGEAAAVAPGVITRAKAVTAAPPAPAPSGRTDGAAGAGTPSAASAPAPTPQPLRRSPRLAGRVGAGADGPQEDGPGGSGRGSSGGGRDEGPPTDRDGPSAGRTGAGGGGQRTGARRRRRGGAAAAPGGSAGSDGSRLPGLASQRSGPGPSMD